MRNFYRYITVLLILITITTSIKTLYAQGDVFVSYKNLLENKGFDNEKALESARYLENNWYCFDDRVVQIDSLLDVYSGDSQAFEFFLVKKAFSLNSYSKFSESRKLLNELLKKDKVYNRGVVYELLGKCYLSEQKYANAYNQLSLSRKEYEDSKDTIGLINHSILMLHMLNGYRDMSHTSKYYYKGLLLAEAKKNDQMLIALLCKFAAINIYENPQFAEELFLKAWNLSINESRSRAVGASVPYLKFLITLDKFSKFNEVYEVVKNDIQNTCNNYHSGTIYTLNAFKFSKLEMHDSSRFYNKLALERRMKGGTAQLIGSSHLNLLKNAMNLGESNVALEHLKLSEYYLLQNATVSNHRYFLQYKKDFYTSINNIDSVVSVQNQMIDLDKKFYAEQKDIYISRINLEHDLKVQLERDNFEIEMNNRKSKMTYLIVISVLLLIIIIGLTYLFVNKSRRFNILKIRSKISFASINEYKKEIKQLKNVFENAITGFFILDKDFKIRYVNKRAESIFYSHEKEMSAKLFLDMFSNVYSDEIESGLKKVYSTMQNYELQVKHRINESDLILNLSFSPMIINNELESILVIALDISSRVKALELEKKQSLILQTLFNSVTESIILLDGEGNIESINETAAKRLGKSVEELIGDNYFNQLPETVRVGRIQKVKKSIQEKKAVIYDENIDSYNSLVSIYPSFDADGDVNYIAEFLQDITERRMAVEQINSLRQKVLRSQMNPHFVFNSLNAIQSYVLKNDSKMAVKYLNSFAKLIRLILDSSRYDYINLDKEIHILEYYLDLQQLRFGDKFDWTLHVDPKIDTDGTLIPAMLAQPFIENAIEHGLQHLEGTGNVKISFVRDKETIVFKVVDNGIGRDKSKKLNKGEMQSKESLSTKLFKERLYTLNKYNERKITYDIIDLKDDQSNATGTMVVINLPIIYSSNID